MDACREEPPPELTFRLHASFCWQYAVGTPAAMDFYLRAWEHARALWAAHPTMHLVGERLMHEHLAAAPFTYATFGDFDVQELGPMAV